MHQSTTPSLSQTIWPRWASRQLLSLPIVQVPVTFAYSQSSDAIVMRQLRRWKRLWRMSLTRSHKRTSIWAFQKLLERYNKCIAAGGDYFEGDSSFICVLSIKVSIRKKCGNLFNDPCNSPSGFQICLLWCLSPVRLPQRCGDFPTSFFWSPLFELFFLYHSK